MQYCVLLFLCALTLITCIEHDFKGFDDTILFGINWPGKPEDLGDLVEGETAQSKKNEVLKVTSTNKETYECQIPELKEEETINIAEYDGPTPMNLLKPLFARKICSYRLESYWSYEVCHGRYIKQYHEERDGKQVSSQEYFLGFWSKDKQIKLESEVQSAQETKDTLNTTKVDGANLPFIEMVLDEGTLCDIHSKPRLTRVRYVCYTHGKHEVYSFKETSTCEYEIIILSPLLCDHPLFKPKDVGENMINCIPVDDAPKKPRNLLKMEVDSLRFHHQTIRLMNQEQDLKDVFGVLKVEKIIKDGETHLKFEMHPLNEEEYVAVGGAERPALEKSPPITDDSPVRAFLNGENCLNGGSGWWKYEFCYGKHVLQYHVDRDGEKTTLNLGKFVESTHLNWIKENKGKVPKPIEQRTSVSHIYTGGDVCDKTGKQRQTEVKLKCLENSSSPAQVSLYLLEPKTCHYILGVESPLICDILPLADENGLIQMPKQTLNPDHVEIEEEDVVDRHNNVVKFGND